MHKACHGGQVTPESLDVLDLDGVDLVLVVPPMAHLSWPALGVHLLQAIGREEGLRVRVVYLTTLVARRVGPLPYAAMANAPSEWMLGERLLAWRAWDGEPPETAFDDLPLDDRRVDGGAVEYLDHMTDGTGHRPRAWGDRYTRSALIAASHIAAEEIDALADALVDARVPMVGATTSFDQTAPAIALHRAIKARNPAIRTLLGGPNCEAPMGEAIAAMTDVVDHVFCGESDEVFRAFLRNPNGAGPIVYGSPVEDLDALPGPRYEDYLAQLRAFVPSVLDEGRVWLAYESSRGCWWGEKQHCTFCGLNGLGMGYRLKSPEVVRTELRDLLEGSPTRYVAFTDNILPHAYHRTLIPTLAEAIPDLHAFYEIKANMTLPQVAALADAGIKVVQPGIEALSTPILKRMRKGVFARQNLALLRYAAACDVLVKWNHLYGFPGDTHEEWAGVAELMGLLHHLTPPAGLVYLSIDRFSPYFEEREAYGISQLEPAGAFREVFPAHADHDRLAYHFIGQWTSASRHDASLHNALHHAIETWRETWRSPDGPPVCTLRPGGRGSWLLVDTRWEETIARPATDAQARAALVGGPWERVPLAEWAVKNRLAARFDGWCVPLATASRQTLLEAEARWSGAQDEGPTMVRRWISA